MSIEKDKDKLKELMVAFGKETDATKLSALKNEIYKTLIASFATSKKIILVEGMITASNTDIDNYIDAIKNKTLTQNKKNMLNNAFSGFEVILDLER